MPSAEGWVLSNVDQAAFRSSCCGSAAGGSVVEGEMNQGWYEDYMKYGIRIGNKRWKKKRRIFLISAPQSWVKAFGSVQAVMRSLHVCRAVTGQNWADPCRSWQFRLEIWKAVVGFWVVAVANSSQCEHSRSTMPLNSTPPSSSLGHS